MTMVVRRRTDKKANPPLCSPCHDIWKMDGMLLKGWGPVVIL